MATPQGGLNQASAQAKPPAPVSGKFDTDAAQAENLEKQSGQTNLEKVAGDLDDQREAMNKALLQLRAGLDSRKNRMFDPVLMQVAAGFLKPTKTGSFGESLGYAAENAGVASEREMLRTAENQKLEMELMGKEQEFRQQLAGDQLMGNIFKGARPAGAARPAASPASSAGISPASSVATAQVEAGQNTPAAAAQVQGAATGRLPVTEEHVAWANRYSPKMVPVLEKMLARQQEDIKINISERTLQNQIAEREQKTRKVTPVGLRTEREITNKEYNEYRVKLKETGGDPLKMNQYYAGMGWLEQEQGRVLSAAGKNAGTTPISAADYNTLIAKTASELNAESKLAEQSALAPGVKTEAKDKSTIKIAEEIAIATGKAVVEVKRDLDIAKGKLPIAVQQAGEEETARERAKESAAKATKMANAADVAFGNTNTAKDMIAYAKNNPKILAAMNKPGVLGAITRAAQEGISVGNFSVNIPAKTLAEANLTTEDLAALQMFAQKYAELQSRGRQLNRTPGEGSTSDYETRLLGAIYALPSDSQRAVILKSEALILQSAFDEERQKLWTQKSKKAGYSYNDFMGDDEFKDLKNNYRATLDRVRDENMDLLSPKPRAATSSNAPVAAPAAPAAPAATTPAKPAPVGETYSQRLERLKKERGGN